MLLVVPILMTVAQGCKTVDEIQSELKSTGVPVITSMVPEPAKVGAIVTLRGLNLETKQGRVGFQDGNGNVSIAEVQGWADDFIVVKLPPLVGNPAESKVHVVTASGKVLGINPNLSVSY